WYGESGSSWAASEPIVDETFTTRGAGERSSSGRKPSMTATAPKTFVSYVSRNSAVLTGPASPAVASGRMPALLTRTSRRPAARSIVAAASATEPADRTSSWTAVASPPRSRISCAARSPSSRRRAPMNVLTPASARRTAVAYPSPRLAPVMSATFVMCGPFCVV
ncbi:MAG: hypothetical protein AVDCRST_MAG30-792, partial [uncultured Solirubrobacteraceae bacterium]